MGGVPYNALTLCLPVSQRIILPADVSRIQLSASCPQSRREVSFRLRPPQSDRPVVFATNVIKMSFSSELIIQRGPKLVGCFMKYIGRYTEDVEYRGWPYNFSA